jgi:hypothetical protein
MIAFNLEYYTEVQDLDRLEPLLDKDPRTKKFSELNRLICEIVEDFSLVSFETLCVEVSLFLLFLKFTSSLSLSRARSD